MQGIKVMTSRQINIQLPVITIYTTQEVQSADKFLSKICAANC